mmetsp:Transcript_122491/g.346378  ORF Transcript_122491/g.346378 Transcript_122491/m.346378 type:complete len:305 (-) Transcript_122491:805-1719(-)
MSKAHERAASMRRRRSIIDRWRPAVSAAREWHTVALNCCGSPISTKLAGDNWSGISVSTSCAWAASSQIVAKTARCLNDLSTAGRPAQFRVQKRKLALPNISRSWADPFDQSCCSFSSRSLNAEANSASGASVASSTPAAASRRAAFNAFGARRLRSDSTRAWRDARLAGLFTRAASSKTDKLVRILVCRKTSRSGPSSGTLSSTPTRRVVASAPSRVFRNSSSTTKTALLDGAHTTTHGGCRLPCCRMKQRWRMRKAHTVVFVLPVPGGPWTRCTPASPFWCAAPEVQSGKGAPLRARKFPTA